MQTFSILKFLKIRLNRRMMITLVGIAALLLVVMIASVNATASPRSIADGKIAGWVSNLNNDKLTADRQEAQRNLEAMGEAAVPQLIVALRSDNSAQRRNAADVLGYIASPGATEALRTSMNGDPVPAVRRNAAWALGEIKAANAINDLQQASITDRSQIVRGAAADSLARIRTSLALSSGVNEQFVGAYAAAPSKGDVVYLAAKRDVLISQDGGKSWKTLATVLPSQVSALAVNPKNAQELYAGVEALGIYKSVDGGATWNAINSGVSLTPGARETVSAIAIDPQNASVLYVARGVWIGTGKVDFYPVGLMVSRDSGSTWQALTAGPSDEAIAKLAFRDGQLYGLAGNRVLTLLTPQ